MAHEIFVDAITGRAPFAYAVEDGPGWWEGDNGMIGTKLASSTCGVRDACEASSLLWQPIEERLKCGDGTPTDSKAIRRSDTGRVLGVVSLDYGTVPHALHFHSAAIPLLAAGGRWSSIGAVRHGARYFASFKVGSRTIAGDEHKHIVSVIGSYDKSAAVLYTTSAVRVVCNNTLSAAIQDGAAKALRFAHHKNANAKLVDASKVLATAHASIDKLGAALEACAATKVTQADMRRVLERLYPPKVTKQNDVMIGGQKGASLIDEILDQPNGGVSSNGRSMLDSLVRDADHLDAAMASKPGEGRLIAAILDAYENAPGARPGNAYGLIQAVTYYETHERGRSAGDRYVRRLTGTTDDANLIDVVLDEMKIARR